MKIITTAQVKKIKHKINNQDFNGVDGSNLMRFYTKFNEPEFYWKEADSYLFKINGKYLCVTKTFVMSKKVKDEVNPLWM